MMNKKERQEKRQLSIGLMFLGSGMMCLGLAGIIYVKYLM